MKALRLIAVYMMLIVVGFTLTSEAFAWESHPSESFSSQQLELASYEIGDDGNNQISIAEPHEHDSSHCSDTCHDGFCHFGHCSYTSPSFTFVISFNFPSSTGSGFKTDHFESPSLEGLKRPPRLA